MTRTKSIPCGGKKWRTRGGCATESAGEFCPHLFMLHITGRARLGYLVPVLVLTLAIFGTSRLGHSLQSPESADTDYILARSTETNEADWQKAPDYDYFECDHYQGDGSKSFAELMILGSRYERLVAIDGKPLSLDEERWEQQRLNATVLRRRKESALERNQRLEKYEKTRKRDHALIGQIIHAFRFEYLGEQSFEGRDVYVLRATPRPDYRPPNLETEVLKGMEGELWIDKESFNWVRVEAQVIHPVSIVSYLARVEPGTKFELEMSPVAGGMWLPSHFAMRARAKVLFFFRHESQQDESYYGYHPSAQY